MKDKEQLRKNGEEVERRSIKEVLGQQCFNGGFGSLLLQGVLLGRLYEGTVSQPC